MQFAEIQKTTLLDYPGKVAATIFTYGCNFRCPFCHNPELVTEKLNKDYLVDESDILAFLEKRKGLLDALVVTGGEPLIHKDLSLFLQKVKDIGYLIKVDTNGSFPNQVKKLIKLGIVDYWAMDIKNSEEKYLETNGLDSVGNDLDGLPRGTMPVQNRTTTRVVPTSTSAILRCDLKAVLSNIKQSISLIVNSGVDYEFRTTVVPDLHDDKSMKGIGELIKDSRTFYIQNFRCGKTLDKSFEKKRSFSPAELNVFKKIMKGYVEKVEVRGI